MDAAERAEKERLDAIRAARNRVRWGWDYFNWIVIGVALIVVVGIWFLPSEMNDPKVQEHWRRQSELWDAKLAREAEEARRKKEAEEMGLIYIEPGMNIFPTKPPAEKPQR